MVESICLLTVFMQKTAKRGMNRSAEGELPERRHTKFFLEDTSTIQYK